MLSTMVTQFISSSAFSHLCFSLLNASVDTQTSSIVTSHIKW